MDNRNTLMLCIGLGVLPIQLLNLGVVIPQVLMRIFVTRTPRGQFFLSLQTILVLMSYRLRGA